MATVAGGRVQMYGLLVGTDPGTGPSFPQGSVLSRIKVFKNATTLTPTTTTTSNEQTFAISGLASDDLILGWQLATPPAGVVNIANMRVTTTGTLGITFVNASAASATFAAITPNQLSMFVVNVDTN